MPWGRCDDGYWRNLKTLNLAPARRSDAISLFWLVISWSNDVLADGYVTLATVRMLGYSKPIADELVRVGSWEGNGREGYRVHDYFKFNRSKTQILADRAKWAADKAEQRAAEATLSGPESTPDIGGSDPAVPPVDSTPDSRAGVREGRDAGAARSPVSPVPPNGIPGGGGGTGIPGTRPKSGFQPWDTSRARGPAQQSTALRAATTTGTNGRHE